MQPKANVTSDVRTDNIGSLVPPGVVLRYVRPDATLHQAVTIMLKYDFSQLPIMSSARDVKGLISWKTIARKMTLKRKCSSVNDCRGKVDVLSFDESIFSAIPKIAEHDCVLVQAADRTISGIVTAADLSYRFGILAEPFLKIGEIETLLRKVLLGQFTEEELNDLRASHTGARPIRTVADLTLGDIGRLVSSDDHWKRLGFELDRKEFLTGLDRVRAIRNDVMHFVSSGLEPWKIDALRNFAQLLRELCDDGN